MQQIGLYYRYSINAELVFGATKDVYIRFLRHRLHLVAEQGTGIWDNATLNTNEALKD